MKRRVLSVILFAVGMLFCSCKFNSIFNGDTSISINLPFGSARAGDEVKYSFVVDCFEGAEITETAKYTQNSESGKKIVFANVTPGVYTVRVLAYEYNNLENLLYTGQDTKEVFDGMQTTFSIQMKKTVSKGDIDNLNTVYLQYTDDTLSTMVAKTITENGVTPVNYDWYYGSIYLKQFSGADKNSLNQNEAYEYIKELDIDTDMYLYFSVVVKFSNGNYDNYTLNFYNSQIMESFIDKNGVFNLTEYNAYLMTANQPAEYKKIDNTSNGKLNYTFTFNLLNKPDSDYSADLFLYRIDNESKEKPDYILTAKKGDKFDLSKGYLEYTFTQDLPSDYYIAQVNWYLVYDGEKYPMYEYLDLVYIENGYVTNACCNDGEVNNHASYYVSDYTSFLEALSSANGGDYIYVTETLYMEKGYIERNENSQNKEEPVLIIRDSNYTGVMFQISLTNANDDVFISSENGALIFDGNNIEAAPMFKLDTGSLSCWGYEGRSISFQNSICDSSGYGSIVGTNTSSDYSLDFQDYITFYNNKSDCGGAINIAGTPKSVNFGQITFEKNTAIEKGGAIYIDDYNQGSNYYIVLKGISLINNSAQNGGGIYVNNGHIEFENALYIKDNKATAGTGGGIYVAQGEIDGNIQSNWVKFPNTGFGSSFYAGGNTSSSGNGTVFYFENINSTPADLTSIFTNITLFETDSYYKEND